MKDCIHHGGSIRMMIDVLDSKVYVNLMTRFVTT